MTTLAVTARADTLLKDAANSMTRAIYRVIVVADDYTTPIVVVLSDFVRMLAEDGDGEVLLPMLGARPLHRWPS